MTELLKKAKWIAAPEGGDTPPVFRKVFNLDKACTKAVMAATALGVYDIYINGERVGDEYFAPGWTEYKKRLQYQIYDIAGYLKIGENTIEVTVAPGWCVGQIGWQKRRRVWAAKQGLLAYIDIDGAEIVTDGTWRVGKGPIEYTEYFFGERVDARKVSGEFTEPVFLNRSYANLIPQEGESVRIIEELKPTRLIHAPNGETVIDFGQNMTGFAGFKINAKAGDKVSFDHAEELDSDGNFYRGNYRDAATLISYICKDGEQEYHPRFAWQGFRYIRLLDWPGKLETLEDAMCFTACVVHSDMKRTGDFECSNPLVNQLFKNIIWGQRGNFLDVPTDCPQRSERLGWTGDAQIFVRTASYNYDVEKFFRKWLRDLSASQFPDGGVPRAVPDLQFPRVSPAVWADAAVIVPWHLYMTYGNKQILEEQFESMRGWVEHVRSRGSDECLWDDGWHYGDWLAMDVPCPWDVELDTPAWAGNTHPYLVATAFFAHSTDLFARAGRVLGYDMSEYEDLHRRIKEKFIETFYEGDLLISDTQSAWILGLYFDLLKDREFGVKRLAELLKKNDYHLTTGFPSTPYLLHALSDNGEDELAYTMLLQETAPGWLFSVKQGATTIWEHWDSIREDGSMWSDDMNSFNHYSYGSVGDWLYQTAAGIAPTEEAPGFKHIKFAPKADKRLGYCRASIDTRNGKVEGGWKYEGDKVKYHLTVPDGCTAEVHLGGKVTRVGAGEHEFIA